jgi:hypothetical protein
LEAEKGGCSLEGISDDVLQFTKGCEILFSVLAQNAKLSDIEKQLIAYYWRELTTQTEILRTELDKAEQC